MANPKKSIKKKARTKKISSSISVSVIVNPAWEKQLKFVNGEIAKLGKIPGVITKIK